MLAAAKMQKAPVFLVQLRQPMTIPCLLKTARLHRAFNPFPTRGALASDVGYEARLLTSTLGVYSVPAGQSR